MHRALASKPRHDFGTDEFLIKACADWHVVRAQQQLIWAENDAATTFGLRAGVAANTEPLDRMRQLEDVLAQAQPRTILLAQQLLGIVATILAHEDKDSVMARGPLLAVVRNVEKALDYCNPTTKVGDAALPSPDDTTPAGFNDGNSGLSRRSQPR